MNTVWSCYRYYRLTGLGLLFGIYLIWQVPHVIALRSSFLLGLCLFFLLSGVRGVGSAVTDFRKQVSPGIVFIAYAAFLLWLLFVAVGIAAIPSKSLAELKGQWLPPTLYLLIGYGAMRQFLLRQPSRASLVQIAFWALVAHAVLQLIVAAWKILQEGSLPLDNFGGISDHKANVTYTNMLALSLLLTEMAFGSSAMRFLRLQRPIQGIVFGILLISTFLSGARNGIIVFLFMTLVGAIVIGFQYKRQASRYWWVILTTCGVFIVLGTLIALKSEPRWERFTATVPVAWDIDSNLAWVNTEKYPVPLARDGQPVDNPTYERIAFARAALRFAMEYPFGTKVSREAFKDLVTIEYAPTVVGHPHNSYLDLWISVGLPGVALWVTFLGAMIWSGYGYFQLSKDPAGIALVLVVVAFALRSLLDSIVRDHIIQEFMLTCGLLLGCIDLHQANQRPT